MRVSDIKYTVLSWTSLLVILIFVLVPFQGFLTVWASSLVGHYTAVRLWDDVVLLLVILGSVYLLFTDKKIRFNTLSRRLVWVILGYIFLSLALGLVSFLDKDVTGKAVLYGLLINLRYLAFFLVTWCVALRISRLRRHWPTFVLWPAVVVVAFGLLQIFVLPHDFLRHFGYGPNTIPVIETVNSNAKYVRIPSTLRGANPLGAYLIIPISILAVFLVRPKKTLKHIALFVGAVITLFYTYSRSALFGAFVSVVIVVFTAKLSEKTLKLSAVVVCILVIAGGIFYSLDKNNAGVQNLVLHTQKNSVVKTTSDQNHESNLKIGVKQLIREPLGRGPGTAGPASVYNNNARIAENYYVQIGQEVGWLGLVLFLLINVGVGYLLWLRRDDPLALALFASLIGISIVNMFSHAWADDTLAYTWWGLAGIAMAPDKTNGTDHAKKT
ncbi:MAG TPA: O-antigen ligase family protein [Candidatus Sulfotelmatobacter sp.]|nr:O-antigen ligase family protein [Candidatus Sulfotelmatobacter sp.]